MASGRVKGTCAWCGCRAWELAWEDVADARDGTWTTDTGRPQLCVDVAYGRIVGGCVAAYAVEEKVAGR